MGGQLPPVRIEDRDETHQPFIRVSRRGIPGERWLRGRGRETAVSERVCLEHRTRYRPFSSIYAIPWDLAQQSALGISAIPI